MMILPIYTYGHSVLKKRADDIDLGDPNLKSLLEDMWETMYNAHGVGLAAPQVGRSERLFIIDTVQLSESDEDGNKRELGYKGAFINPFILTQEGANVDHEEGCLSIPGLRSEVTRSESVRIAFYDDSLVKREESFNGMEARVILHEYDHLEGILFTDKIKPLKRTMLRRKLEGMKRGKVIADYPIRVPR